MTMTVAEIRAAIRDADFIFLLVPLFPNSTRMGKVRVGQVKARRIFQFMNGDEVLCADYDTTTPGYKMLFLGTTE